MHFKRQLQAKLSHRIGYFLLQTGRKRTKGSVRQKAYYFREAEPSYNYRTVYFDQCIFQNNRKCHFLQNRTVLYLRISNNTVYAIDYKHYVGIATGTNDQSSASESHFLCSSLEATYGYLLDQTSYSRFDQFFNSGQAGSAGSNEVLKCFREFSFQHNRLLYCRTYVKGIIFYKTHHATESAIKSLQQLISDCYSLYSRGRAGLSDYTLPNSNARCE